jgi:Tol biopolymer transport system component
MRKQRILAVSVSVCLAIAVLGLFSGSAAADGEYPVTNEGWTRLTTYPYNDAEAVWSPDGAQIAWRRMSSNNWNRAIWTMNADGSNETQLTFGSVQASPDYSPDGQKIAFWNYHDDSYTDIVVKDLSTGDETVVLGSGYNGAPRWSPDGSKILFDSSTHLNGTYHVYVMNADGSGVTQLTFDGWMNTRPDWSPDGAKIVFSSDRAGSSRAEIFHLYTMDADGSNVVQLVEGGAADWSPDGDFIAFSRSHAPHFEHIFVMRSDGTDVVQITDSTDGAEGGARWSSDGTKLLFHAEVDGNKDIYTVDVDLDAIYGSMLVASADNPEVYPGDPVDVALTIEDAHDLYAAQAKCGIDPSVLELQSAVFGDFFDPASRLVGTNEISPSLGIWSGAVSQQNPALPLSGDGLYATLTFEATGVGTTTIACDPLFSDRDGFTQTVSFTGTMVTVLPYATITGTVTYQGRLDHIGIDVLATGTVNQADTTDSNGDFVLGQLRAGTYDVKADASSYLPGCITTTLAAGDNVALPAARLLGGDLNDDEVINIGDATLLTANFGEMVPPADARADINADGMVNVQDLAILAGNYEVSGCQEW